MQPADKEGIAFHVNALSHGDEAAFAFLYKKSEARLYTFAYKLTQDRNETEEIVQEAFLKVWEKRASLDSNQNFDAYLFTIAKNIVYNKAKQRAYHFAFQNYLASYESGLCYNTEQKLEFEELKALLDQIYTSLPPVRRKVFMMSRLQGLSNSEIAAELNTSTSNIENHLNKALRYIREKLEIHEIVYVTLLTFLKL